MENSSLSSCCDHCFGLTLGSAHAETVELELLRVYPARPGNARDDLERRTYRCPACSAIWLRENRPTSSRWLLMSRPLAAAAGPTASRLRRN